MTICSVLLQSGLSMCIDCRGGVGIMLERNIKMNVILIVFYLNKIAFLFIDLNKKFKN